MDPKTILFAKFTLQTQLIVTNHIHLKIFKFNNNNYTHLNYHPKFLRSDCKECHNFTHQMQTNFKIICMIKINNIKQVWITKIRCKIKIINDNHNRIHILINNSNFKEMNSKILKV